MIQEGKQRHLTGQFIATMGKQNSGWRGPSNGGTHVGADQLAVKTEIGIVVFNKPETVRSTELNVEEVRNHVKEG